MVEIDWNAIATLMIPAMTMLGIAVATYLLNERAKRKSMKRERLWNLKCEKFERLLDLFDHSYALRRMAVEFSETEWNDARKKETIIQLLTDLQVLLITYPEHYESWLSEKGTDVFSLSEMLGLEREEFMDLRDRAHCSTEALANTYMSECFTIVHTLELHLTNPQLLNVINDMIALLRRMHKMRTVEGLSYEEVERKRMGLSSKLRPWMKKELEDTLKS